MAKSKSVKVVSKEKKATTKAIPKKEVPNVVNKEKKKEVPKNYINIDEVKRKALSNSGCLKNIEDFDEEEMEAYEAFCKVDKGRALADGIDILQKEKWQEENKELIAKQQKEEEKEEEELQKKKQEELDKIIDANVDKYALIRTTLHSWWNDNEHSVCSRLIQSLPSSAVYSIRVDASLAGKASIRIMGHFDNPNYPQRINNFFYDIPFGDLYANGEKDIKKDIKTLDDDIQKLYGIIAEETFAV